MRYDAERQSFVGDNFVFPVAYFINEGFEHESGLFGDNRLLRRETRVARGYFENRWGLSIIWGSCTYSDNYYHPWGRRRVCDGDLVFPPFVEEPDCVEVAIVMPEPKVVPAQSYGPLPVTGETATIPEHETALWGEVIGYVIDDQVRFLCSIVSKFNSDGAPEPREGPYIAAMADGTYVLNVGDYDGEEPQ